ncbi:putative bifunctional diguanylate cyclase/phosphodiesterase [Thiorhodococcus fuscus]|uniref:Bifunctional diguanylate cyclase/phosphodiesterase n=1 Tax=Thiorhodococcus fuscus TaxID=527200 RepID=A0ABW4Y8I3_9GAMM
MDASPIQDTRINLRVLHERASRASLQGILIAIVAVILATLAVCYVSERGISLEGLINAQRTNFALWVLDLMPFVFAYVGQYVTFTLAREANSLVRKQTRELRDRADDLQKQATFAATHDHVTELPNRALFSDRIDRAIRVCPDQGARFGVLFLAIENLNDVQDTLGAASSDLLLRQIATRLTGWIKPQDSLARLESHVFGLMIQDVVDHDSAEKAAHGLQKAMDPPFQAGDIKISMHTSIGIVIVPEHGEDQDLLLQRAGVATYMGSRAYNGFAIYSPTQDDESPRRLTLMGELRQAIDRGQFMLYHQPKIDIASGRVIGSEALIRWYHGRDGFIPPEEFVGLAERTRMIRPLTLWVLEHAFNDCAGLHRLGFDWTVSINLSARDLHDPEFPDLVAGMMARTGIQPDWVMLEITESSIMADPVRVLNVLERIHSMGFHFSIDDFGTGYSSLAYLKKLPVSELKIDKSFVMDMPRSESDGVIVRATVELGHNLGLKVTAEGVEDAESLRILRSIGCDTAQGYYFSKPRPLNEILAWQQSGLWKASRDSLSEADLRAS